MFGLERRRAVMINAVVIVIASLPCVFGYNIWSNLRFFGGRDVLDTEDFLVSNLLLPIGSLIFCLFCTLRAGWGYDHFIEECNTGRGLRYGRFLKPYFKYILPLLILIIIFQGLT